MLVIVILGMGCIFLRDVFEENATLPIPPKSTSRNFTDTQVENKKVDKEDQLKAG